MGYRLTNGARSRELDQGTEQQPSGSEGEEEEDEQEGDAFHSLRHVKPFAKEAARALDLVEVAVRKGALRKRAPCVPLQRSALHLLPMVVHEHVLRYQNRGMHVIKWLLAVYDVIGQEVVMQTYVI